MLLGVKQKHEYYGSLNSYILNEMHCEEDIDSIFNMFSLLQLLPG